MNKLLFNPIQRPESLLSFYTLTFNQWFLFSYLNPEDKKLKERRPLVIWILGMKYFCSKHGV